MSKMTEKGVSDKSTKYFLTPSSLAKSLFFYITRCGHYYCSDQYAFDGASEVGQVSSRRNFLLFYIRSGDMSLRLDRHDYTASSNVEAVAEAVGLSDSHLTRLFRTTVGISPYEYIILQRIDRAKTLLSTTDEPIKTIAFEVGYSSETTFSAAFTEKTGVSPRYYRKLKFYLDH